MSATTDSSRTPLELDRLVAETNKLVAESSKMVREAVKLSAEAAKLDAETRKLDRDLRYAPWLLGVAATGGVVGAIAAVITAAKSFGFIH